MEIKRCSKCKEQKKRGDFRKNASKKDGLSGICKSCAKISDAIYRAAHHEQIAQRVATWHAEHREDRKAYYASWYTEHCEKMAEYRTTYREDHHEEIARQRLQYRQEHRDEIAAKNANWQKANPDKCRNKTHRYRARKRGNGGTHTTQDVQRQGDSQKWLCWWCLKPCKDDYHIDHLVPLAKGGHNNPSNIVISCPQCNCAKQDKMPGEFLGRLL